MTASRQPTLDEQLAMATIEMPLDVLDVLLTALDHVLVIGPAGTEGLFDAVMMEGGK
jgi:hypothetical protein